MLNSVLEKIERYVRNDDDDPAVKNDGSIFEVVAMRAIIGIVAYLLLR